MKHLGVIAWGALCTLLAGKVIFIIYMSLVALAIIVNVVYAIKNVLSSILSTQLFFRVMNVKKIVR